MSKRPDHNPNVYPGLTREEELYTQENERMVQQKGGEQYVTSDDVEEIERRVQEILKQEHIQGLRDE
jgi:Holliday junction resolvase RusA-like endonuclease